MPPKQGRWNSSFGKNVYAKRTNDNRSQNRDGYVQRRTVQEKLDYLVGATAEEDRIDELFGYVRQKEGSDRLGWLLNVHPTMVADSETRLLHSSLDCYFLAEDMKTFKVSLPYKPYFFLGVREKYISEIEAELRRNFGPNIADIEPVSKVDLDLSNHLSGLKKTYLRISFRTVQQLISVRHELSPMIEKNRTRLATMEAYEHLEYQLLQGQGNNEDADKGVSDRLDGSGGDDLKTSHNSVGYMAHIYDIREYDVPYYLRCMIDMEIRVGQWYLCSFFEGECSIKGQYHKVNRPQVRVFAFDIETTKSPLKFPDPKIDSVMMISYMVDGQGFLIVNRETVSEDIEDFEYTPTSNYPGSFVVFNELDEISTLKRFFSHIRLLKPHIFVSFNGDFFDWPFIDARSQVHKLNLTQEIGIKNTGEFYSSRSSIHLDAFAWVRRDSYLPQGSQGLKAVTKAKLGFDPLQIDPENMVRFAQEKPQVMAAYSVSDALSTYFIYMKYVHPFIFSLCTIIPMNPDDVLRKGTGTLCETLLMAEAFKVNLIFPNKKIEKKGKEYNGHYLKSETYVGGHVECLESGIFRDDVPVKFVIRVEAIAKLISEVDGILAQAIEEGKMKREDLINYDEVKNQIIDTLNSLMTIGRKDDVCYREENPTICHLDVAAMYPNIILTNRLQPSSIVSDKTCVACCFNNPQNKCQRRMEWQWRAEYYPPRKSEHQLIRAQLEVENFRVGNIKDGTLKSVHWHELSPADQEAKFIARLKDYSQKVYKKQKESVQEVKVDTVCMRENPFYVDTVKAFRDRRYEYKGLLKTSKIAHDNAVKERVQDLNTLRDMENLVTVYDSLQLAHKCILNSFYGYVMRKGARWYSMEMAGIVTFTGARIITMTRELIEQFGRPLELDTDGIWCILPQTFPENYQFLGNQGKKFTFSFPCVMLNYFVSVNFTNHQYQTLVKDKTDKEDIEDIGFMTSNLQKRTPKKINFKKMNYKIQKECSIFFEVDGPYKAMILPASKEKDKKLKKRYAVFNRNGTLAELKGFEIKRRGELKLIKIFQSQVFDHFLNGSSLEEIYDSVASVADHWLSVLESQGSLMTEEDILELITESSNMSKTAEEYAGMKSSALTASRRLSEFLGDAFLQTKGLASSFIIARLPFGVTVTERAVPTSIFQASLDVQRKYLAKWQRINQTNEISLRSVVDWNYYKGRLISAIQKIITIPAALQGVKNPIPRVIHPDWLVKELAIQNDSHVQSDMKEYLGAAPNSGFDLEADELKDNMTSSILNEKPKKKVSSLLSKKRKYVSEIAHSENYDFILNQPIPNQKRIF